MERPEPFSPFSEDDVQKLYPLLRKMAGEKMSHEKPGQTLQPTALVHEAWLRLRTNEKQSWRSESHFCAAAAESMRRILIERARSKGRLKRGSGQAPVRLEDAHEVAMHSDDSILQINEALVRFSEIDPQRAQIVVLKFFGGFSTQQIAAALHVNERTIERHWAYSRAWLYRQINDDAS